MEVAEARLRATVLALYPWYEGWDEETQAVTREIVQKALEAADAVMFSDESVSRSYPFVYSFLKRRGMVPRGKEVNALVGYVVTGLRGGYDVG